MNEQPPLRLMVFDATCAGRAPWPGLSTVWRSGGLLYGALGRIDARRGVRSWSEALTWLAQFEPGRAIGDVQYWGHGTWGCALVDRDVLDVRALVRGHALHDALRAVRARMTPASSWWFRTCETFGTRQGHDFARAWTDWTGCRAAAHTYVIGALQSGLHSLAPGAVPDWSVDEGLAPGARNASTALPSRWNAPRTVTCLQGEVPAGW